MKTIIKGAAGALMATAIVASVAMYADVQITKEKLISVQHTLEERETTTERFTQMMYQMDKTLAVQSQSVAALEGAVDRLERFVLLAYKNEKRKSEEALNDSGER